MILCVTPGVYFWCLLRPCFVLGIIMVAWDTPLVGIRTDYFIRHIKMWFRETWDMIQIKTYLMMRLRKWFFSIYEICTSFRKLIRRSDKARKRRTRPNKKRPSTKTVTTCTLYYLKTITLYKNWYLIVGKIWLVRPGKVFGPILQNFLVPI